MGDWVEWIALLIAIAVAGLFIARERRSKSDYFAGARPANTHIERDNRDWPTIVRDATDQAVAMARPAVALSLSEAPITEDPHSSLGGLPSMPKDTPWPLDNSGKPMIFLAQINFADMPSLEGYPTGGLLSFYVQDDDLNGCDFPSTGNKGFRVTYVENTDDLERRALPELDWGFTPLNAELTRKGRRLIGDVAISPVSPNSVALRRLTKDWYPDCPGELWDEFYETLIAAKTSVLYYGGHPDFTQDDFRREGDDPAYTDVLLQLGFLFDREKDLEICWGDAGEACFLITKEDLAAKRFDRVAYNWDCS